MTTLEKAPTYVTNCVRLHVDEFGHVWSGHNWMFAKDTRTDVETFLAAPPEQHGFDLWTARRVKILGTPGNAGLVVGIVAKRSVRIDTTDVWVGSPAMLGAKELGSPKCVLRHLWQPEPLGRNRDWHPLTSRDYPSYAIAAHFGRGGTSDEFCARALQYHPAWPALSFCGHSVEAACRFVVDVMDPRWFRDPLRPGRLNKLLAFLGVTPENVKAFLKQGPKGRHWERFERVLAVWFDNSVTTQRSTPQGFLYRILASTENAVRGLLSACRRFVQFVRDVWLGEVVPSPECRFVPEFFFKNADEIRAYKHHRKTLKFV